MLSGNDNVNAHPNFNPRAQGQPLFRAGHPQNIPMEMNSMVVD